MSRPLEGRVAVITGAGGDIGGAAAVLLAERGAAIVAVDRNPAGLAALQGRLPNGASLVGEQLSIRAEEIGGRRRILKYNFAAEP